MRSAAASLMVLAAAAAAAPRVHLQTSGLDLYCACDEQQARAALERLLYVRGLFETFTGGRPRGAPARISLPGAPSEPDLQKAALEYARALLRQSEMSPPLWATEGLAEYLSTARPGRAGEPPPGRVESLQKGEWLAWDLLFAIDAASPLRNEQSRQGALYDQGWALIHIYAHSRDLRPALPKLFASAEARPDLTYDQLDARFRRWLYPGPPPPESIPIPPELASAPVKSMPATDFEAELVEAMAGGRTALAALAKRYPQRPEPFEELARLQGPVPEALSTFEKAWSLGGQDPEVLWYYSELLRRNGDTAKSNAVLQRCLQSEPAYLDARLVLATDEIAAGRPDRALGMLRRAPPPPPRRAAEYYRAVSNAARAARNRLEAERAAQQLLSLARTDSERREAEDLLRMARDTKPAAKETGVNISLDDQVGGAVAPPPARTPSRLPETYGPKETGTPPPPPGVKLDGTLVQVDCRESSAFLYIETAQGKRRFLIDNPNAVIVRGTGTATLSCGAQSKRVSIEYEERENTDPVVRVIEFR